MFAFGSSSIVGLDVSVSSVKLVELTKAKGRYRVERMGIEPLPKTGVAAGTLDIDTVAAAIATLFKRTKSKATDAATALPGSAVIIKVISMPGGLNPADMEEQIRMEGGQYIPYSMDGVNFDFTSMGPDDTRTGYEKVLLVACKRDAVEDRTAILDRAGIHARVVDVEPFTLLTVYEQMATHADAFPPSAVIALVDIGATTTKVNVFQNGQPVYNREHSFGGDRLTEEIMYRYRLSYEDAGRMKRTGGLPEDYHAEVLEPFIESMALDLRRSLEFFQSNMPNVHVDQIVVFGGCAQIPNIGDILRERSQLPVIIADPFVGMDFGPHIDKKRVREEGPSLAVACGLALRKFDAH